MLCISFSWFQAPPAEDRAPLETSGGRASGSGCAALNRTGTLAMSARCHAHLLLGGSEGEGIERSDRKPGQKKVRKKSD